MTLKFAMLGTGRIATMKLLPALAASDKASLWSVLSRDMAKAESITKEFGAQSATPAYDDLATLLADPELDGVIIATPDKLHAAQAIAAAESGKHVFCEKPMATSVAESQAMVDACKVADVKLGVAYHMRWHAGHRKLFEAVQNGLVGTPRHMRVQWSFMAPDDANWRATADVAKWWGLAGVGTHCLDQVLWYLEPSCGKVTRQQSLIARDVWKGPHDETALIHLQFESGATAELCSSVLFNAPTQFELYGDTGFARGEDSVAISGKGRMWTHEGDWNFEPIDPYRLEIEDFADSIIENRKPEVDGHQGLENVQILLNAVDNAQ